MFYVNSCPAHKAYPTRLIALQDAVHVHLGSKAECNERTINKYILPGHVESCQLVMGLTKLEEGSVWNTMPSHTHERRMEAYLYFDMKPDNVVFHLMGEPKETRHIVMRDREAGDLAGVQHTQRRGDVGLHVHLGHVRREPGLRRHGRGKNDGVAIKGA